MKATHLIILMILLILVVAAAKRPPTGSISGTITDTNDSNAIYWAKVRRNVSSTIINPDNSRLSGLEVKCIFDEREFSSTVSDKNGSFSLQNLKPGRYKIQISAAFYEPYTSEDILVEAGKTVKLNPVLTAIPYGTAQSDTLNKSGIGRLALRVRDSHGNPLQFVNVSILKDGARITGAQTNEKGMATIINIPADSTYTVTCSLIGFMKYTAENVHICEHQTASLFPIMQPGGIYTQPIEIQRDMAGSSKSINTSSLSESAVSDMNSYANRVIPTIHLQAQNFNTEQYEAIEPNIFHSPLSEPLSTFSIDVDTANYSNIRRIIRQGYLPEPSSVRIEELVNYFAYDYPMPENNHPFTVYSEMSVCPWNQKRNLVHIGLQGKKLDLGKAPPSNLVFLLDVSGSMDSPNKLPLLKKSMKLLVNNLRGNDKVAIVVYAGAAGEVLPSTSGNNKKAIFDALDTLHAGGSTAGGAGIQLAYKIAKENLIPNGNNRIILCTDGDFNVGASSRAHLSDLIESNRNEGVFLTVLGYGMGNYKDNTLELLADKGNGNYAYIDDIKEAKKFLVNEMVSTLYTIAKDVKLQIEFNPAHVKAYRLIGYENRLLNKEDFKDDTKDAGELGAGHNVTAVYEIIPMNSNETIPELDELKYQDVKISSEAQRSPEIMTIKLRYKLPDGDVSIPFDLPVKNEINPLENASESFKFSSAVIGYGMMLQNSEYKESLTWQMVKDLASASIGKDTEGYRAEFLILVDSASKLWEVNNREENRDFNKGN
ncbi:MAG: von Willebrand factor type A domain-containing protein [Candidatus Cloacimonadaceae bacterium]|jgi:Ca-activated chloride channel family protein|nr:von Willebrand factor type A domain-containing protein [Candidatus Cloacimonadota bacterium]MDY0298998.1 von Willebrand factor type A domain-containing protein [Candidatus Cloacimonadaceae bacterium]